MLYHSHMAFGLGAGLNPGSLQGGQNEFRSACICLRGCARCFEKVLFLYVLKRGNNLFVNLFPNVVSSLRHNIALKGKSPVKQKTHRIYDYRSPIITQ